MLNSFYHLDPVLQTFWGIAIFISVVFLIQTVLTFVGMDWSGSELNADFDGNLDDNAVPFQLFTLRNLINFLIIFSWSGIAFYSTFSNIILIIILATISGILFVFLFFLMLKKIEKLSDNNTFDIAKTVGMCGEVYLKIPKKNTGKGKILISYKGSIKELDAVTEGDEIKFQTQIKIIDFNNYIVKVEKNKI